MVAHQVNNGRRVCVLYNHGITRVNIWTYIYIYILIYICKFESPQSCGINFPSKATMEVDVAVLGELYR